MPTDVASYAPGEVIDARRIIATFDELAPIGPDRVLMRRYCAGGAVVQHAEHLLADHVSETSAERPGSSRSFSSDLPAGPRRTPAPRFRGAVASQR